MRFFVAIFNIFNQPVLRTALEYGMASWFIWAPPLVVYLFWQTWLNYIRLFFIRHLKWVLLEIKIPRDISKSPRAVEVILSTLHNTRDGNLIERYWYGFLRMWYSLEIVSISGQVHFFVYIQSAIRNFVESQIYAQYPEAEIIEAEDYTPIVSPQDIGKAKEWSLWGVECGLTKEEAYPIKSYIEFGLEAGKIKEEEKTDPLTSFLEALVAMKEGEQIWFQILIKAADKNWKDRAESIIKNLREQNAVAAAAEGAGFSMMMMSPGQREVLLAVERNVAKLGFDVGIRGIYLAKKETFNSVRKGLLPSVMKQYSTQDMNGFRPARNTSIDYFFKETRELYKRKKILRAYRQRSYFYIPYRHTPFVLSTEALATIFHFPGRVAETPTLGRIEAKKGEPPVDLPV